MNTPRIGWIFFLKYIHTKCFVDDTMIDIKIMHLLETPFRLPSYFCPFYVVLFLTNPGRFSFFRTVVWEAYLKPICLEYIYSSSTSDAPRIDCPLEIFFCLDSQSETANLRCSDRVLDPDCNPEHPLNLLDYSLAQNPPLVKCYGKSVITLQGILLTAEQQS